MLMFMKYRPAAKPVGFRNVPPVFPITSVVPVLTTASGRPSRLRSGMTMAPLAAGTAVRLVTANVPEASASMVTSRDALSRQAKSMRPSRFTSAATSEDPIALSASVCAVVKPAPVLRRIATDDPDAAITTATSGRPSLLKSCTAAPRAAAGSVTVVTALKVPSPRPV